MTFDDEELDVLLDTMRQQLEDTVEFVAQDATCGEEVMDANALIKVLRRIVRKLEDES